VAPQQRPHSGWHLRAGDHLRRYARGIASLTGLRNGGIVHPPRRRSVFRLRCDHLEQRLDVLEIALRVRTVRTNIFSTKAASTSGTGTSNSIMSPVVSRAATET
jgi:hypothetical protein